MFKREEQQAYCYFKDGVRKIDFVLVYEQHRTETEKVKIETFLTNLRRQGIQMEFEEGVLHTNLIFVKLHAPEKVLLDIASIHHVVLTYENDRTIPTFKRRLRPLKNVLAREANPRNPMFKRTSNAARGLPTTTITSRERILLINYVLSRTDFGDGIGEYGFPKLINNKTLLTAYPLHDGGWQWQQKGFLTERQLLARYWANAKYWYAVQPIHLIYHYCGSEVAFRFAWLGYYNKMLIPISIIGVFIFLYSLIMLNFPGYHRLAEFCTSDMMICPTCIREKCTFKKLSSYCKLAYVSYLFDNWASIIFAVIVSIWATFFVEFWKRRETNLKFKWNLLRAEVNIEQKPEFEEKTPHRRISTNTGTIEAYIPLSIQILHYGISAVACFLMIIVVVITVIITVILGRILRNAIATSNSAFLNNNIDLIYMTFGSTVSVLFIRLYDPLFTRIVLELTKLENYRTTLEYYNSYIIKRFLMNFCNNYLPVFYLVLVKGRLFTYPGDLDQYHSFFGIPSEVCHPSGCLSRVTIYLCFLMVLKKTTLQIVSYGALFLKHLFKRAKARLGLERKELPQWEEEYMLEPIGELHFVGLMMDRVLQYGIILFFVSALPLLPLIALIGNIAELRLSAYNLVRNTRRSVPRRLPGLGAWNGVIAATTYFSVFFNAIMIAFTTEFVSREVYRYTHGSLAGYINSTFSEFAVADFQEPIRSRLQKMSNISVCYYKGYRHKPNETDKYKLNDEYYYHLGMSFFMIISFEHIVLILTGILAYAIPDIPFVIKEHLAYEEQKLLEAKRKN